ncbi:ATP-binding protein [Actinomadura sp. HBU206391]|uniref:ATP-binding protein n=1 Tax=Actinomadura sp. HBU206391 TaxID=2731692 RepID=UPI00164FC29E|nr:ATP-binding protein [Actinomadura sp. HBU206391]MBC6456946.1 PspC domain-containing protein [Actinomadura sp. HBU206391]
MTEGAQSETRLVRRADGRLFGGVARGLADHLGLDLVIVRLAFVLLVVAGGMGMAAYAAFWVLVPQRDEPAARRDWLQLAAYGALIAGLSFVTWSRGLGQVALWPLIVCGIGCAILWQQADRDQRQRWVRTTTMPLRRMWIRSLVGMLLVLAGIGGFVFQQIGTGQASGHEVRQILVATTVILAGVAMIATPWVLRLWQDLDAERRERIRSQERAELAAHVHDSVLHTLTLIQRNAGDTREVQRLARSQERELRSWLYAPRADPDQTLAAAVQKIAGEVEDDHGVPIEVVCVGDCPLDTRLAAMLQAVREAMVNAAKYAGAPSVSVFAEVEGQEVAIFVRDRGKGFDLDAIPPDRMGVRGSIIGRMDRNGGTATVRTAPGEGTEVRFEMKRS